MPLTKKDSAPNNPRDIYFWLKIIFLFIGGAYLAGKVLGEYFFNAGVEF